jgi:hypothetical protein
MTEQNGDDDTIEYDYNSIYNGFKIKKDSIDSLAGPIVITIENTTLGTSVSSTLTP